jgi:hypothetical protein
MKAALIVLFIVLIQFSSSKKAGEVKECRQKNSYSRKCQLLADNCGLQPSCYNITLKNECKYNCMKQVYGDWVEFPLSCIQECRQKQTNQMYNLLDDCLNNGCYDSQSFLEYFN